MAVTKNKVRANLVIDIELKKKLEEIAKEEQRSFNNLVNKVLFEFAEKEFHAIELFKSISFRIS